MYIKLQVFYMEIFKYVLQKLHLNDTLWTIAVGVNYFKY